MTGWGDLLMFGMDTYFFLFSIHFTIKMDLVLPISRSLNYIIHLIYNSKIHCTV